MKILQVNVVYKKGSTGKIVNDISQVLINKGHDSIICYGRGDKNKEENVYKTSSEIEAKINTLFSRISGLLYSGCIFSTMKLIKLIKKEKPDVVHLQCINGYFTNIYRLLEFLKKEKIKTILTLHAEFMYTGNCGYAYECKSWKTGCGNCPQLKTTLKSYFFDRTAFAWTKMKRAFDNFDENLVITSVSEWLEKRAKESPILAGKCFHVVENGIDTKNIFYKRDCTKIKEKIKLKNKKVLLYVTANFSDEKDNVKGGQYIIELAKRLKKLDVAIIVISGNRKNMELPENIINIGEVKDQNELARYYSLADLSIITSKKETFSMPCAESLSCGTPIVGFKAGAPEMIALKEYSEFVEYGNINELEKCVIRWIDKKNEITDKIQKVATEHYSKEKMCEKFIELYGG